MLMFSLFCCCMLIRFYMFISIILFSVFVFFFFKQKTAYEMRISDWSSDVCSSDLFRAEPEAGCNRVARGFQFDWPAVPFDRSEERRVGKSVSVRVDLGGRRIIKKKKKNHEI